ncbi:AbfB domain-containing protein [Kitasatospora sp. NPDC001574]
MFASDGSGVFPVGVSSATGHRIRHRNSLVELTPVVGDLDRADAAFMAHKTLNESVIGIGLESINFSGRFLRHQDFRPEPQVDDGSELLNRGASHAYGEGSTPTCVRGPGRLGIAALFRRRSAAAPGG